MQLVISIWQHFYFDNGIAASSETRKKLLVFQDLEASKVSEESDRRTEPKLVGISNVFEDLEDSNRIF